MSNCPSGRLASAEKGDALSAECQSSSKAVAPPPVGLVVRNKNRRLLKANLKIETKSGITRTRLALICPERLTLRNHYRGSSSCVVCLLSARASANIALANKGEQHRSDARHRLRCTTCSRRAARWGASNHEHPGSPGGRLSASRSTTERRLPRSPAREAPQTAHAQKKTARHKPRGIYLENRYL